MATGTRLRMLELSPDKCPPESIESRRVISVACSLAGRLLATGESKGSFKLWDMDTGSCIGELEAENDQPWGEMSSLGFSSDGQRLVTYRENSSRIEIWDVRTRERLLKVAGLTSLIIGFVSFDHTDLSLLTTNLGTWNLPPPNTGGQIGHDTIPADSLEFYGLGVTPDFTWVVKGTERLLWIPQDYRNRVLVTGFRVVLLSKSGDLLVFNFSPDGSLE